MLGSMYTAANFMGTNNCSSILPLVSTERTVLYRERFAGMYSPWAYSFAQMFIEIPYVFLQAAFFVVITYPAFGYYWSASKFLWFFYTMFCTLLYFVYLGMFLVSLTPNLRVASILSSPCYAIINLFSGFMVPGPMSLAEAKRSLVADGRTNQQGLHDKSPNNHYFDSEDTTSQEFKTPESTPAKQPRASAAVLPVNSNGTRAAVSHMAKEFEQKKKDFEDDARLLIEVKSGQSPVIMNPDEELQKLKVRFVSWKKDYKVKLREAKAELQKIGNLQAVKPRRRWWSIWIRR